ncbi:NADP-reducing hydrogenase subunit HndD [Candidatus Hakubella thermalkaliphila]|uniref:NADP-reducing hydrogenase subunit HndD n=1 Tax=Candidatus Hakubella thermalkaliphila TaxID=2754717 RepID=A0A6V8Q2E4_9ACTN|nr:[FeFe] hydrogenase, group A [Candidatus Hakubella thermalkaliphila]MBT9168432.1 NADP-reducing hydrogenase subunit HndC [Bacillota bacterium]GFP37106.1 NADP-reducing hydrogenase subunit HndD [Candidatus Hakubella thermalkaliphila]GFP38600.1 NADP-reducing hydrogenase subunit HndD [Candidatus Hakubella thermalkaliphila]GFP42220.1 NADP-reducing hydrogenase subunit HndD [Candidatus Hakubella thermalkaliphila]
MSGTVTIDRKVLSINGEENILELIRKAGVDLPAFCYHFELADFGACRMCIVEEEKMGFIAACHTLPADGMVIRTTTPHLQRMRRTILELLLADHDRDCAICEESGQCRLQELTLRFGIDNIRFGKDSESLPRDESSASLVRNPNKCVLCGNCVRNCREIQGIGVLDFAYRGAKVQVMPAFGKSMAEVECVGCGQCILACPTAALRIKFEIDAVWDALNDPGKRVIVQTAPAVRVALGEEFGGKAGAISTGKMVAALRRLGFHEVYDTCFGADLTAMEETTEFLHRFEKGEKLPQFTSCCPAWVKYAEHFHSELLGQLSTCRSPHQMLGSLLKKFYAPEQGLSPQDLFVVSVMPCTAKKFEARRPEFTTEGSPDVDAVISTHELARMIREMGIVFEELEEDSYDLPFGFASGAGTIFGYSSGVSTAVVRTAIYKLTGKRPPLDFTFTPVEGFPNVTEAIVPLAEGEIRISTVHTLGAAKKLIAALQAGKVSYHLVEVMACPEGCIGGGGQPLSRDIQARPKRTQGMRGADRLKQIRTVQDNPFIEELYQRWLKQPGSDAAHHALHTTYASRRRVFGQFIPVVAAERPTVDIKVCVGTSCYLRGSYGVIQKLIDLIEKQQLTDRVNLEATFCLEQCDRGPSVVIDGHLLEGVAEERLPAIFEEMVVKALA